MPTFEAKVAEAYLAKSDKEHRKYECRLQKCDKPPDCGMRRVEKRNIYIHEICSHTPKHGNRQRPILQETEKCHTLLFLLCQQGIHIALLDKLERLLHNVALLVHYLEIFIHIPKVASKQRLHLAAHIGD